VNLATLEPGLLTWLSTLTGTAAALCVKANASRPVVPAGAALVLIQWVSIPQVGLDATAWEYDDDAPTALTELTPSLHGDRRPVLQVDVEVEDQRSGYDASAIAQRIVDRCRAPSSLTALGALNVALAGVAPVRRTDYPFNGRMTARATVELTFNAVSHYTDTAGQTATITSVQIGATVTGSAGTALPDTVDSGGTFS
jgi:hypothetical protein